MKKYIVIICCFFAVFISNAQVSSALKIKDLQVIEEISSSINPSGVSNDSLFSVFKIMYKISDVSIAKKIYAKFGNVTDDGSVLNIEPSFINQNGSYFLRYDNENYPIINYTSSFKVKILKTEVIKLKFLTIQVEDMNALRSSKLYFQIKP